MNRIKQIMLIVPGISIVFILTGCGTTVKVSQYPTFYQPSIKEVAVLPFENQTPRKGIGRAVAGNLAATLAANRTYKITGPAKLEQLIKEKKISALPKNDYKAVAEELGKLNEFQAFIAGEVLSESFKNIATAVDDIYDYDDFYDYDAFYPYFYYPYYYDYGTEVYLSVEASIVSVPQGTMLDTTLAKATSDVSGTAKPLHKYATQIAINDICERLLKEFAVVPVTITVHPDRDLRTADSFQQEKWHFTRDFSKDDESMYVVLCLPAVAAHNQFRLTITPAKNKTNVIAKKDITWQPSKYCQGFEFSPREIAATNGPGRYSVQFYSRGKVVMTSNFRIK